MQTKGVNAKPPPPQAEAKQRQLPKAIATRGRGHKGGPFRKRK